MIGVIDLQHKKAIQVFKTLDHTNRVSNSGYYGRGVFCFFSKSLQYGSPFNWFNRNLTTFFGRTRSDRECYYTPNTMASYNRGTDNVVGYNALYFDLDSDKSGILPMYLWGAIKPQIDSGQILKPTYVVMTGHGLDMVYVFDHQVTDSKVGQPYTFVKTSWNHTENELGKRLNKWCFGTVDFGAMDNSRLLRMPETNNCKYLDPKNNYTHKVRTRVLYYSGQTYDFWKLYRHYCPKDSSRRVEKESRKINFNDSHKLNYFEQAELHRALDVKKYVKMQGPKIIGRRNKSLFIYASLLVQANRYYIANGAKNVKQNIMAMVCYLNLSMKKPDLDYSLSDTEVNGILSKVSAANFGKRDNISKYHYKTNTICGYNKRGNRIRKGLNISVQDQLKLKYLRGSKAKKIIRNRRARDAYRQKKLLQHAAYHEKDKQAAYRRIVFDNHIIRMHHKGMSYRAISKAVNISRTKVARIVTHRDYIKLPHDYDTKLIKKLTADMPFTTDDALEIIYDYVQNNLKRDRYD